MELLILECRSHHLARNYRGTNRMWPAYREDLPEDHPVNRLYRRFSDQTDEMGTVSDLEEARDLVRQFAAVTPPQDLEVVELTRHRANPEARGADLLGYDLSTGGISLIEDGLMLPERITVEPSDILSVLEPLFRLVERCYRPLLNSHGLFRDYETAESCLQVMQTLNKLRPGAYEDEDTMRLFEVIGIWRVFTP